MVLIIEEFDGLASNQIYKAAEVYLGTKVSISAGSFRVSMPEKETKISTLVAKDQVVLDKFNGIQFKWRQVTRQVQSKRTNYPGQSSTQSELRYFELCFHKKYKNMVFESYFPFVLNESN